jgi:NitT/TauT family transport system ATP-binding protein
MSLRGVSVIDARAVNTTLGQGSAVTIERLSKQFDSNRVVKALEDVNLTIEAGGFMSIVGPSGCGKSTLLNIVGGLTEATQGAVQIGGVNVNGPRTDIGIVFQTSILLPWKTILQNVLLPVKVRRLKPAEYLDRAHELLNTSGLEGFAGHYPYELSGGMRQRASICRALLLDPPVLLMDEPFGALDALTRDVMNEELGALWRRTGKTILLVTHSITEAVALSRNVTVMSARPGRIERTYAFGLPEDVSVFERVKQPDYIEAVSEVRSWFMAGGPGKHT